MVGFDMLMRENFIGDLRNKYKFIEYNIVGKSLCGRDIGCLKIGSSKEPVLFAAAFHGMEWLTSLLVLTFVKNLCKAIYDNKFINHLDIKTALNKNGLIVVPCVNPDGVEISINGAKTAGEYKDLITKIANYDSTDSWQANARGVDLNHNFNANWEQLHQLEEKNGIVGPAPTRYGGENPESEPETKALIKLCKNINFRHVVAFHSQGEEIYWNFGEKTPEKSKKIAESMAKLSGYKISSPEGLAVGGGFKDWFIQEFGRPGFTVEIGRGKNPLSLSDIDSIYKKLENMLLYCCIA